MAKTRGAAGAAMTEVPQEIDSRPRQGDPLEQQVIEPAAQPIVSEGSPSMHAMVRGDRPGVNDFSAATDDAWRVERSGGRVIVVETGPENFKVTTPHDLQVAGLLLSAR